MFKDYYQILGVKQASELKDIKKSYRELALKYHPDINKLRQAKEKFIEATEAYVVLKNVDKRRLYNKLYNQYYSKSSQERVHFNNKDGLNKQDWAKYGKEKAKEYSSAPIEELARRILKEIKAGSKYIPHLVAVVFIIMAIIGGFIALSEKNDPIALIPILLIIVVLASFAIKLFKVVKKNFLRRWKNNRNSIN